MPFLLKRFQNGIPNRFFSSDKIIQNDLSFLISINFGFYDGNNSRFSSSIFKDSIIEIVRDIYEFKQLLLTLKRFNKESKLINLTNELGGLSGNGTSIWEIDYNNKNLFDSDRYKYMFIFPLVDISSLLYFWNIRATYSFSNLIWLTEELLDDFSELSYSQ